MAWPQPISFEPSALVPAFTFRLFPNDGQEDFGQLIPEDSSRVWFQMSVPEFLPELFIAPQAMNDVDQGIAVSSSSPTPARFLYSEIGPVVGFEWFFFTPEAGVSWTVLTVSYKPGLLRGITREQQDVLRRFDDRPTSKVGDEDGDNRPDLGTTVESIADQIISDFTRPTGGNGHL